MKFLHAVTIAALSLGLSGCAVSEQQFVKYRAIIRTRPDIRAKMMANCIRDIDNFRGEKREAIAMLLDAKASTLSVKVCSRFERAYIDGRMSYQDYRNIASGKITVRTVRLLRGH